MIDAWGATPLKAHRSMRIAGRADDSRHDGAVAVAVVGAVAGEHIIPAGDEIGKKPMARHAGVDDGHSLAGPRVSFQTVARSRTVARSGGSGWPAPRPRKSSGVEAKHCSRCSVDWGGAGGWGLGRSVSSTGGGDTAIALGAVHNGMVARTTAATSRTALGQRPVTAGSRRGLRRRDRPPNTPAVPQLQQRGTPAIRRRGVKPG